MFYMMYTLDDEGKRVYSLKQSVNGVPTEPAHPAHFTPEDKNSRYRIKIKKRFGLHITQQEAPKY